MKALAIQLAGELVLLTAGRALYWPRQKMLVIADIHFGKAASFRRLGVPVPRGTTTQNLELLDSLLLQHQVEHIVFLGDFLHSRSAHAEATVAAMLAWRRRHAKLTITLVRGNHDRHAGDPAAALALNVVEEPFELAPFAFCHHPEQATDAYVLAGHVHPVLRISSRSDSLRLPCFWFGQRCGILPAFGAFTGGHVVRPPAGDRVFVTTDDGVFALGVR